MDKRNVDKTNHIEERKKGSVGCSDVSDQNQEINKNGTSLETVSGEAEDYLKTVSDFISHSYDPKLKREQKKLSELLESYRKLCNKLQDKISDGTGSRSTEADLAKIPEIYAILHPELYTDVRDQEKQRLITKLSRKPLFGPGFPRQSKSNASHNLYDLRQKEKERFTRLVASAPTTFHNVLAQPSHRQRRSLPSDRVSDLKVEENIREKEKDRLARIFATTHSKRKSNVKYNARKPKEIDKENKSKDQDKNTSPPKVGDSQNFRHNAEIEVAQSNQGNGQESEMVRVGEYSPLNRNQNPEGRLLGLGEFEERRKQRFDQRKREYREHLSQARQAVRTKLDKGIPAQELDLMDSPRTCSAATQTDDLFEVESVPSSPHEISVQTDNLPSQGLGQNQLSPLNHFSDASPKEKLMFDLQGSSNIIAQTGAHIMSKEEDFKEHRYKQMVYAEALRSQIQEKKRIEDERRRREKEEEEWIEKKAREQQERLQMEYKREQNQRLGNLQQRAAQEELVRQRLVEMELEADELKKVEKRKKRESHRSPNNSLEQSIPGRFSQRIQEPRSTESFRVIKSNEFEPSERRRFDHMSQAPLLESDPQNILSAREFRGQTEGIRRGMQSGTGDRSVMELQGPRLYQNQESERPPSPIVPALRTETLLKKNTRLLEDKWKVPDSQRTVVSDDLGVHGMRRADNILTQLGVFRRQLQLEHVKMQRQLEAQSTP